MAKNTESWVNRTTRLAYQLWGDEHWKRFVEIKEGLKAGGKPAADAWIEASQVYPPPIEFRQEADRQFRAARKKQFHSGIQAINLPRPAAGKPDRKATGNDLFDWLYANWSNPTPEPEHPGDLEQLAYYRKNEKEFRELWIREWRRARSEAQKESARRKREKAKRKPAPSEPMNEHDAELAKTIAEIR